MSHDAQQNGLLPDLFTDERWAELSLRLRLTGREAETARFICRGVPGPRIATEMGVSRNTARMHVRRLYRKLNIHDRAGVPVRFVLADRDAE